MPTCQKALACVTLARMESEIKFPVNLKDKLATIEKEHIDEALAMSNGNKSHAAQLLQMNRTTLVEKMRKYGYKLNPTPLRSAS